ncbi:MAG: hypothetical protein A2147_04590 [Chloroflexi bacterium RBG_16_57_8]|nr:MAG: hypothetical protein A2147_04590 [Chloroflexi bacterium RBG_16_57_8]
MYVKIDRLEFVVTWKCNSACKHCLVGDKRTSKAALSPELAARIVRQVAGVYPLKSMMIFGGEPLLFPDVVCAVHGAAKDCGVPRRDIITNAGYPRSDVEFRKLARRLSESGVTNASVSVDAFHQEHIPVETIERNVQALLDAGIAVDWDPCWVISADHQNPWNKRTWEILEALAHLAVPAVTESDGNVVQPAGNALRWLREYLPPRTPAPDGACEDVPYAGRPDKVTSISVEPDASVSVCKDLTIGDAHEQNVVDILRDYDPYRIPEMAAILRGGVAGLREFAGSSGITPDPVGYYSICDECVDLRRKLAVTAPR